MTNRLMSASVAIFSTDGQVLLIRRAFEPYAQNWTLPGGRAEQGESPSDCARREVFEETSLSLDALMPIRTIALAGFELHVFASVTWSGSVTPNDEISDWRWCHRDDYKDLAVTPDLPEILDEARRLSGIG